MKIKIVFLMIIFAFGACIFAQSVIKKYDIKSGIVTFETISKMGAIEIKSKSVVYFDDYGMKECNDTFTNSKLAMSRFSDGKNLYSINFKNKTISKIGSAYRGTEVRVDWYEFGTPKDRASGKIKKLPPMNFAGKTCEVFKTDDGKGTVAIYAGWNKILFFMDVKTKVIESIRKAVKVEVNSKVPSDKFKIPAGFKKL